ncbi:MAG: universal stress protein, partial [Acidimicrobiia bacterium]
GNDRRKGRVVMSEHIVVGIDGSESSTAALQWALDEAQVRSATVKAVRVWRMPYVGDFAGPAVAAVDPNELADANRELLDSVVDAALATRSDITVERVVRDGNPAAELADEAADADLLVVGSRGRGGFAELMLGSVSHQVAAHAPCPVAIVRGDVVRRRQGRVVVGIDGSEASKKALAWATEEARLRGAELHLVYASTDPLPEGKYEMSAGEQPYSDPALLVSNALEVVAAERDAPNTFTHIVDDTPANALLNEAKDAAMVVVSSRGRGGFKSLVLGSVSHQVAVHAPCPVVVVRA